MADFAGFDAALLTAYLLEKKTTIFRNILWQQELGSWMTMVPNIKKGMFTPKFSVTQSVKPFNTTISATDNQVWDANVLQTFPNKIEELIDPQKYYDRWESLMLGVVDGKTFEPGAFPLHEFIVETMMDSNSEALRETAIWSGVRDNGGTGLADTVNGFGTIITDAVTSGDIPAGSVVATGTITAANTYDKVREVVQTVPLKYRRQKDFQVTVSDTLWGDYYDGYVADHGGVIAPDMIDDDTLVIDKKFGKTVVLKRVQCMTEANSQRIIATMKSNLQGGTNVEDFGKYIMKLHDMGWTYAILAYFELGLGIFEMKDKAIVVNDQE